MITISKPRVYQKDDFYIQKTKILINKTTHYLEVEYLNIKKEDISQKLEPITAQLLLIGMVTGQNIHVDGALDKTFTDGISKIQDTFIGWDSAKYKRINIIATGKNMGEIPKNTKNDTWNACSFTGGVDSFYTLKTVNDSDKVENITHALHIHGFDIRKDDYNAYTTASDMLEGAIQREMVTLLRARSNLRTITDKYIPWDMAHGLGIIGTAMSIKPISRLYIASSYDHSQLHPWGSHPDVDEFVRTKNFTVIHHGLEANRTAKVKEIGCYLPAQKALRVCSWFTHQGTKNCSKCSKCVRTMCSIKLTGQLDKFETFQDQFQSKNIRKTLFLYEGGQIFVHEIMEEAKEQGDDKLVSDLKYALRRSYIPSSLLKIAETTKISKFAQKTYSRTKRRIIEKRPNLQA